MNADLQQFDLTRAARDGDLKTVVQTIAAHPDIPRFLALFEAIKGGHKMCVDAVFYNIREEDLQSIYDEGGLLLYAAVEFQQWGIFNQLFALVNPEEFEDSLFACVVRSKNVACFNTMKPHLPVQWDNAVRIGIQFYHEEILQALLEKYSVRSVFELSDAMKTSLHAIVDLLMKHSSDEILHQGLCWAAAHCSEFVPQLLHCDPKANDSKALKNALSANNIETVKLLAPVSDVSEVLKWFHPQTNDVCVWLEEWMVQDLNTRLHGTIDTAVAARIARKM